MKRLVAITAAVVASAALAAPAAADHSWGSYHWGRTTATFGLQVGDNVDASWQAMFDTAVADWSKDGAAHPNPMTLTAVAGRAGKRCGAVAGTIQVCNGGYGKNGWLGLATISISGGHITAGTSKMNDAYFTMAKYNNPNERLHVMCQEIGHDFGLGHTSEDGSSQDTCMDYFSNTGANAGSTVSTRPNEHDYEQIGRIYDGHLDAKATFAGAPASSMADDENARPYKTVRNDGRHHSTIIESFPDGSKRVTGISWAHHH